MCAESSVGCWQAPLTAASHLRGLWATISNYMYVWLSLQEENLAADLNQCVSASRFTKDSGRGLIVVSVDCGGCFWSASVSLKHHWFDCVGWRVEGNPLQEAALWFTWFPFECFEIWKNKVKKKLPPTTMLFETIQSCVGWIGKEWDAGATAGRFLCVSWWPACSTDNVCDLASNYKSNYGEGWIYTHRLNQSPASFPPSPQFLFTV